MESGTHWRILNFFLFVGVLFFVLRRPLREFWATRSHQIRFEMDEVRSQSVAEEERHRALVARLEGLEKEAEGLVTGLREEGGLERARLISEAEERARKMLEDSHKWAEREIRKACERLRAETVGLSIQLAERVIREKLVAKDQEGLTRRALDGIGARGTGV